MNNKISVVVCTRNNANNIGRVMKSIIDNNPYEIIVMDGKSSDGTREILNKLPVRVYEDPGKGLASARKEALDYVSGDYVLFVGDDNVLYKGSIEALKEYIIKKNWCGGAFQTRIYHPLSSYWAFCSNLRWIIRFTEGEKRVIGTPYLFEKDLICRANYDEKCGDADDADMEIRIMHLTSKKFGYSNLKCLEIGRNDFNAIIERFRRYGKSDYEYWHKYSGEWKISRRIKSILHPLKDELFIGIKGVRPFSLKLYSFGYFLIITFLRYQGWISEKCKAKRNKVVSR